MNTTQHLLACLMEECAEVQQVIGKSLRFGLDDVWPNEEKNPDKLTNAQRLRLEMNDIFTVAMMLQVATRIDLHPDKALIAAKEQRVRKYMAYAQAKGELE